MSKFLVKTTEQYRCDTEYEANQLIEEAKQAQIYEVVKSSIENRQTKAKGEIVDEWKRVIITKVFTDEKEPVGQVSSIVYSNQLPSHPPVTQEEEPTFEEEKEEEEE